MKAKLHSLGDLTTLISSGSTPRGGAEVYLPSGPVMLVRSQNVRMNRLDLEDVAYITDEIDSGMVRSRVCPGDVLLNITGASIGRASAFDVKNVRANVNQHVCIIRPRPNLLHDRYLTHLLCSPDYQAEIMRIQNGGTRQALTFSQISDFLIPLPPLAEQGRIAEILDLADAIRTKRRASISILDELTQTVFIDMFGDPRRKGSTGNRATIPRPLGEMTRIRTGKLDANKANENGLYPFFTCAVEPLRINTPAFDTKAVLIAGNGDLNVKYYEGKFNAYQRTYVIESLNEQVLDPVFLFAFLDLYVGELRRQSIGGVIKYIKLPYLTDAQVPLPGREHQTEFIRRFAAAQHLVANSQSSLREMDALFASLQDRAFRGAL